MCELDDTSGQGLSLSIDHAPRDFHRGATEPKHEVTQIVDPVEEASPETQLDEGLIPHLGRDQVVVLEDLLVPATPLPHRRPCRVHGDLEAPVLARFTAVEGRECHVSALDGIPIRIEDDTAEDDGIRHVPRTQHDPQVT